MTYHSRKIDFHRECDEHAQSVSKINMAKETHFNFCVKEKSREKTSNKGISPYFQFCTMLNKIKCLVVTTLVVKTFFYVKQHRNKAC